MSASAHAELERLVPLAQRRTNQVYVAPEELVFPNRGGGQPPSGAVTYINDDQQLEHFLANCKEVDKLERKAASGNVLRQALNASSLTLPFVKVDLAKWNLQNKVSPNALGHYDYVVVREDHVRDVRIAELLEFYCRTPALRQPQIVFIPNAVQTDLPTRLQYANPAVTVVDLADARRRPLALPRSAPTSLLDFSDLYESRCFERAGAVSAFDATAWLAGAGGLPELLVLGTRVRARMLTAERHHVEADVDGLLRRLDSMIDGAREGEVETLLHLRVSALLQKLFCSEDPRHLTEAIALASALGDELGLAACLRYAEFLDVHPALADHMYRRAEQTFRDHGAYDLAIYCANNRLVAGNTGRLPEASAFESLLAEIGEDRPALYRRHDILYNAGVRHLLDGRLDAAFAIFDGPDLAEGRPLVVAASQLARLICRQLAGAGSHASEAMSLVDYVLDAVPRSNRWHINNLLLNTLVLVRAQPGLQADVAARAAGVLDLGQNGDVRDVFEENLRLAALVGLADAAPDRRISGPFGDFQARFGFALPYFFIWS